MQMPFSTVLSKLPCAGAADFAQAIKPGCSRRTFVLVARAETCAADTKVRREGARGHAGTRARRRAGGRGWWRGAGGGDCELCCARAARA